MRDLLLRGTEEVEGAWWDGGDWWAGAGVETGLISTKLSGNSPVFPFSLPSHHPSST